MQEEITWEELKKKQPNLCKFVERISRYENADQTVDLLCRLIENNPVIQNTLRDGGEFVGKDTSDQ